MKSSLDLSLKLNDIFSLLEADLREVEVRLRENTGSVFPLIDDINKYLHNSGGKRFRPALLLLCSKSCGGKDDLSIELSMVVELIHVATLVHDDIIDDANFRRGRSSVNAKWGNQITVLMGDWLYMTSFHMALKMRNFRVLDVLIDITRKMVEGELIQLEQLGRSDISVEKHLAITRRKTAHLFSGCGRLGAILGGSSPEKEEQLAAYGYSMGMAFQLIDDLLDYSSDEVTLGKPVLKDLEEGKMTLPIIYLLERAKPHEQDFIREVIKGNKCTPDDKKRIMELVHSYRTLEDVRSLASQYAERSSKAIAALPHSIYREALQRFPEFIIARQK